MYVLKTNILNELIRFAIMKFRFHLSPPLECRMPKSNADEYLLCSLLARLRLAAFACRLLACDCDFRLRFITRLRLCSFLFLIFFIFLQALLHASSLLFSFLFVHHQLLYHKIFFWRRLASSLASLAAAGWYSTVLVL